ncbi:MAG: hypothetical protein ABIR13_01270 [Polaromonas sp.]
MSSLRHLLHYQTHSERKLLIYKGSLNCLFAGHCKESLDWQGFAAPPGNLSTKLSTENLDNFKTVKNQGLSRRLARHLPNRAGLDALNLAVTAP